MESARPPVTQPKPDSRPARQRALKELDGSPTGLGLWLDAVRAAIPDFNPTERVIDIEKAMNHARTVVDAVWEASPAQEGKKNIDTMIRQERFGASISESDLKNLGIKSENEKSVVLQAIQRTLRAVSTVRIDSGSFETVKTILKEEGMTELLKDVAAFSLVINRRINQPSRIMTDKKGGVRDVDLGMIDFVDDAINDRETFPKQHWGEEFVDQPLLIKASAQNMADGLAVRRVFNNLIENHLLKAEGMKPHKERMGEITHQASQAVMIMELTDRSTDWNMWEAFVDDKTEQHTRMLLSDLYPDARTATSPAESTANSDPHIAQLQSLNRANEKISSGLHQLDLLTTRLEELRQRLRNASERMIDVRQPYEGYAETFRREEERAEEWQKYFGDAPLDPDRARYLTLNPEQLSSIREPDRLASALQTIIDSFPAMERVYGVPFPLTPKPEIPLDPSAQKLSEIREGMEGFIKLIRTTSHEMRIPLVQNYCTLLTAYITEGGNISNLQNGREILTRLSEPIRGAVAPMPDQQAEAQSLQEEIAKITGQLESMQLAADMANQPAPTSGPSTTK